MQTPRTTSPPAAYDKAIKTLERVEGRAAGTLLAQQAQLDLAYAYWRSGERAQALSTIERFIKLNPSSPALDYAMYLRGVINFNDDIGVIGSLAGQDLAERDQRAVARCLSGLQATGRPVPGLELRRRCARAHGLHRQLAGGLRVVRRALLLPAAAPTWRRPTGRSRRCVDFQSAPATEEALYIMVQSYDRLGLPTAARRCRTGSSRRTFRTAASRARACARPARPGGTSGTRRLGLAVSWPCSSAPPTGRGEPVQRAMGFLRRSSVIGGNAARSRPP